jgi:hypothetical protein
VYSYPIIRNSRRYVTKNTNYFKTANPLIRVGKSHNSRGLPIQSLWVREHPLDNHCRKSCMLCEQVVNLRMQSPKRVHVLLYHYHTLRFSRLIQLLEAGRYYHTLPHLRFATYTIIPACNQTKLTVGFLVVSGELNPTSLRLSAIRSNIR